MWFLVRLFYESVFKCFLEQGRALKPSLVLYGSALRTCLDLACHEAFLFKSVLKHLFKIINLSVLGLPCAPTIVQSTTLYVNISSVLFIY